MKRLWRILIGIVKWTAIVVVALLILGFGLPYVVPKPHVPPLPPGRRTVSAADNGWPLLKAAAQQLKTGPDAFDPMESLLKSPAAPPPEVVHWVTENGPALRFLDESLAKPDLLLPPSEPPNPNSLWDCGSGIRALARFASARGLLQLSAGHVAAGLDDLLKVTRLGQRIENGDGSLVDYMIGVAVEDLGLRAIRVGLGPAAAVALKDHDPVTAWPRSGWTAEQIESWRLACRGIAGTANQIRPFQQSLVEDIAYDEQLYQHPERFLLNSDEKALKMMPRDRSTAVFDIDRTVAQDQVIAAIVCREAVKPRLRRSYDDIDRILNPHGLALLYNPVGRNLLKMNASTLQEIVGVVDHRSTTVTATAAVIALKLYLEQHGHLPASWAVLVQTGLLPTIHRLSFKPSGIRSAPRHFSRDVGGYGKNERRAPSATGLGDRWRGIQA